MESSRMVIPGKRLTRGAFKNRAMLFAALAFSANVQDVHAGVELGQNGTVLAATAIVCAAALGAAYITAEGDKKYSDKKDSKGQSCEEVANMLEAHRLKDDGGSRAREQAMQALEMARQIEKQNMDRLETVYPQTEITAIKNELTARLNAFNAVETRDALNAELGKLEGEIDAYPAGMDSVQRAARADLCLQKYLTKGALDIYEEVCGLIANGKSRVDIWSGTKCDYAQLVTDVNGTVHSAQGCLQNVRVKDGTVHKLRNFDDKDPNVVFSRGARNVNVNGTAELTLVPVGAKTAPTITNDPVVVEREDDRKPFEARRSECFEYILSVSAAYRLYLELRLDEDILRLSAYHNDVLRIYFDEILSTSAKALRAAYTAYLSDSLVAFNEHRKEVAGLEHNLLVVMLSLADGQFATDVKVDRNGLSLRDYVLGQISISGTETIIGSTCDQYIRFGCHQDSLIDVCTMKSTLDKLTDDDWSGLGLGRLVYCADLDDILSGISKYSWTEAPERPDNTNTVGSRPWMESKELHDIHLRKENQFGSCPWMESKELHDIHLRKENQLHSINFWSRTVYATPARLVDRLDLLENTITKISKALDDKVSQDIKALAAKVQELRKGLNDLSVDLRCFVPTQFDATGVEALVERVTPGGDAVLGKCCHPIHGLMVNRASKGYMHTLALQFYQQQSYSKYSVGSSEPSAGVVGGPATHSSDTSPGQSCHDLELKPQPHSEYRVGSSEPSAGVVGGPATHSSDPFLGQTCHELALKFYHNQSYDSTQ